MSIYPIQAPHTKNLSTWDELNGIKRYVVSPCSIKPMIYVETFFPAASLAMFMWLNQFTAMSTMRSRLGKAPIESFGKLINPTSILGKVGKGKRGCGFSSGSSPQTKIGPTYQSTGTDGVTKALFKVDRALFAALFWYSVAETVTTGLYSWMSLAHKVASCTPDPLDGPFGGDQIENSYFHQGQEGVAFAVGPHGWWNGNILRMETGHIYGFIFSPGMISSQFGELTQFTVELRWRVLGSTGWDFVMYRQTLDLIARPDEHVALIADYRSQTSLTGTIEVKCFMTSTIDPPRADYWALGTGGFAEAWRA